jgi:hypothetical protein
MKFVNANQLHRKSGSRPDYLIMAKPPGSFAMGAVHIIAKLR